MTEDLPVGRVPVLQGVHVRTAKPAGIDLYDDLTSGGGRIRNFRHHRLRSLARNGPHCLPRLPLAPVVGVARARSTS
jgi:hypothetical protein